MSVFRGIGVNVHTVQQANFLTRYPYARWVRIDGMDNTHVPSEWSALVTYYKNLGMKVLYICDWASWGSNLTGHLRDVASVLQVDGVEPANEPSINAITAAQYQAGVLKAMRDAFYGLSWRPEIVGPTLNSIAVHGGEFNEAYMNSLAALNLKGCIDTIGMHAYPNLWTDLPETTVATASAILKANFPGHDLVYTEYNPGPFSAANRLVADTNANLDVYGTAWPAAKAGNEAAWAICSANQARHYYRAMQGAVAGGAVGFCLYEGVWSGADHIYECLIDDVGAASDTLTALNALDPGALWG